MNEVVRERYRFVAFRAARSCALVLAAAPGAFITIPAARAAAASALPTAPAALAMILAVPATSAAEPIATRALDAAPSGVSAGVSDAQVELQEVTGGLQNPVAITNAGDGSGRLFITEQVGRVRIFNGSSLLPTPFLDIAGLVDSGGERGLLSVAFDPDYEHSGKFYVYYTDLAGSLVIARYVVSSDPNRAATQGTVLLTIPHPINSNHNGGQLQFGPDGYLYAGTGDGGGAGDTPHNAQNRSVLLGKILRLDVNRPTLIPADNPFVDGNSATRDEIWAYGLRNPWRFSFDRLTGDLWIGDVGQGCWEEVDLEPAGDPGGRNYGWNLTEGERCYSPSTCSAPPTCMSPSLTSPILVYSHADPSNCAITGGYRYRGAAAAFAGTYVYGDYCSGRIWGATEAAGEWTSRQLFDTSFYITTFGEDEVGEIYVADGATGTIYKLASALASGFSDDFEDGDASDWTALLGTWSVAAGDLSNEPARRAEILAPYQGCSLCTVEAGIRAPQPTATVSLLGWYESRGSYVELTLTGKTGRLVLSHYRRGAVVARASAVLPLVAGSDHNFSVLHDAASFQVFVDGSGTPALTLRDARPASGRIGFRARWRGRNKVSGTFQEIRVH